MENVNETLKFLSTVKYKSWGHPMVGIFFNGTAGAIKNHNKWFLYFRNADDKALKELAEEYFTEPQDCINNAVEKLRIGGYLKQAEEGEE